MIDLHSHILPGIDDGAPDLEASLEMGRAAVRAGTQTILATPHVNSRYPNDAASIARLVGELNIAFARHGIPLAVLSGAEVSPRRLPELDDRTLEFMCLGRGDYLLVESPYSSSAARIEEVLFNLQVRGLRPILAHPERSAAFQSDVPRLARLVERGVLCSITSGSLAGRFGSTARRSALELLREGLVHNVASDAHDHIERPPDIGAGLGNAEAALPELVGQMGWLTREAPTAILAGEVLPPRPLVTASPSRLNRLLRRAGRPERGEVHRRARA